MAVTLHKPRAFYGYFSWVQSLLAIVASSSELMGRNQTSPKKPIMNLGKRDEEVIENAVVSLFDSREA